MQYKPNSTAPFSVGESGLQETGQNEGLSHAKTSKPGRSLASFLVRRKWLVLVMLLTLAIGWYFFTQRDTEVKAQPLMVSVELGDIENAVTAAGALQPSDYVDVGAQVSGQLEKLHVEVGDTVKTGDLVAEIDATVQMNKVEAAQANLEALQAQLSARESALELAQTRMQRQTRLKEEEATSQDDYDDAEDQLVSARANLTQLKSQIVQAQASLGSDMATLGYSSIYAPMDGTVVSIEILEGQTLNASQTAPTIMRIADLTTMTVEAEVSEADVSKLRAGMEVYFTTLGSGDRRWTGTLRQILPTPVTENNVVLYTALFDVENGDGALLTAMTAQVFFVTEAARNVLKVPVAAVTYTRPSRVNEARATPAAMPAASAGTEGQPPSARTSRDAPADMSSKRRDTDGSDAKPRGPRAAAFDQGRSGIVKVMNDEGEISERKVTIGVVSRISAEVLSGLQRGERVVAGVVDQPKAGSSDRGGPRFGRPF